MPAFSPEERLAQASKVSSGERLEIMSNEKSSSEARVQFTKWLLAPMFSEQLGFLLVDSPEGCVRIQKLG